jgi:hypothetical protein
MRRDVVVIGGSAGSHKPLMQALARLPSDLPAMVLVALRIAPGARAELADALVKSCALPAYPRPSGANVGVVIGERQGHSVTARQCDSVHHRHADAAVAAGQHDRRRRAAGRTAGPGNEASSRPVLTASGSAGLHDSREPGRRLNHDSAGLGSRELLAAQNAHVPESSIRDALTDRDATPAKCPY